MKVPTIVPHADLLKIGELTSSPSSTAAWRVPRYILGRLYFVVVVLLIEYAAVVSVPHPWCTVHRAVAGAIVFLAVFLFLGTPSLKPDRVPIKGNARLLPWYGACLVVIAAAHFILLKTSWGGTPVVIIWFAAIPLSATVLLCALIPLRVWPSVLRRTRVAWIYASAAAVLATLISNPVQLLWNAPQSSFGILLQRTTFLEVGRVLQLFYSHVVADPETYTLALPQFVGVIGGTCSGIEGLSLTLLFTLGWLWYTRRELRFPLALVLIPIAMGLIWILNILRLVALFMIGNSGHPGVAAQGFHSEAGWIAFNAVALGLLFVADRTPWLRRAVAASPSEGFEHPSTLDRAGAVPQRNAAAIYLMPFLAILAAAMLSKATTSGFEWLYPLRFLAAAAVLWHYRSEYRRMDWAFGWRGLTLGTLMFLMWLALSRWTGSSSNAIGSALATMPALKRLSWIAIRVAAAVVTVPIAEELAFRGFLLRRISSSDVESIAYRAVTPVALLLSAVAFGLMHGKLWLAGTLAGLAYALLVKHTGRLAEAIAAHATTNLLLAAWVLARGDWGLW